MVKIGIKLLIFFIQAIKSKRKIRGKLGQVVKIHVCRLISLMLIVNRNVHGLKFYMHIE